MAIFTDRSFGVLIVYGANVCFWDAHSIFEAKPERRAFACERPCVCTLFRAFWAQRTLHFQRSHTLFAFVVALCRSFFSTEETVWRHAGMHEGILSVLFNLVGRKFARCLIGLVHKPTLDLLIRVHGLELHTVVGAWSKTASTRVVTGHHDAAVVIHVLWEARGIWALFRVKDSVLLEGVFNRIAFIVSGKLGARGASGALVSVTFALGAWVVTLKAYGGRASGAEGCVRV
jgi:hypothetical protein